MTINDLFFIFYQFQVGYMLNPELKSNKAFKEQVDTNTEKSFSGAAIMPFRNVLQKGNTRVLSLLIFYENRTNIIFKVLISVKYCIMDNYLFSNYLCCPQAKLHFANKGF